MVKYLLIKMRNRKFELHLIIQKDILLCLSHFFHYIACNKKRNKIKDKKIIIITFYSLYLNLFSFVSCNEKSIL